MKEYKLTKYACYASNMSLAIATSLSPLLFMTFREMYGISYTLLGLLVVINFSTQLAIDLIFSFFSKFFNIHKTLKLTPLITFSGLIIYALLPAIFPNSAYIWIAIGTVIFSVSAGLNEVLISPTVAAIPSDNPEREMSKLHTMYAWGSLAVVVISTLFIFVFGNHNWIYLAIFWSLIPLSAFLMFTRAKLPPMHAQISENKEKSKIGAGLILCIICIFLSGAAECTMAQWASSFIENAMGIPKIWGDILGVALFALFLLIGRELHARSGISVMKVMVWGMVGAIACYFVTSLCLNPTVGLIACVLTGFFTSMLWPGMLIYVGEKFPSAGVAVYALMAAGGDTGASVAPQIVGILSDKIAISQVAVNLAERFSITAEQVGMRAGLLSASLFPILGVFLILYLKKYFSKVK